VRPANFLFHPDLHSSVANLEDGDGACREAGGDGGRVVAGDSLTSQFAVDGIDAQVCLVVDSLNGNETVGCP